MASWKRIEQAQKRIRERVFRTGMAGKWHVGKATHMLSDGNSWEKHVAPFEEGSQAAKYLKSLPRLIDRVRNQDAKCAESWETTRDGAAGGMYLCERDRLARLLRRFRFRLLSYERLVRQPHKPVLQQAQVLLAEGAQETAEARELASLLRLSIQEFVDLEQATANDLRLVDGWRAEIVAAHQAYAEREAESIAGPDPEAVRSPSAGSARR